MRFLLFFSFFLCVQCTVIAQCSNPVITPSGPINFCQGGSVTLSTSQAVGLSYQWKLNGTTNVGVNSASYIATSGGSYTVTVTGASDGLGGTCAASTSLATVVTVNALPTATITPATATAFCQGGSVVLNANTGTGLSYQWYNNSVAISGATTSSYTSNANGSFTVVVTNTSTCFATSSATVVTVNVLPVAPTSSNNFSRCGSGVVTLSATAPSGSVVDWYSSASGGTLLLSGVASYSSPSISVSTTYYAESRNTTTGCVSVTRTAVTATVNTVPTLPPGTAGSSCGTGTVVISATAGTGLTIDWYSVSTGGSPLLGGLGVTSFTTPSILTTTTYYAEARNVSTGCVSLARTAVTATVNVIPSAPTGTSGARCGSGTVNISATVGPGLTIDWYAISVGGSPLSGGSGVTSFTTPNIVATTIYYAEARNTMTGCISATRTAVTATVNVIPSAPIGTSGARCGSGTVNISATVGPGVTIDWYATSVGGSTLSGGIGVTPFNTPSIPATTIFYAEARNATTGCISVARTPVTATVNIIPVVGNMSDTICSGDVFSVIPQNAGSNIIPLGTTYSWTVENNINITGQSAVPTAQNSIGQALTNSSNVSQNLTYNVAPSTVLCPGGNFNVIVTIKPKPSITTNLQQTICTEQSVSFTPENIVNGIVPSNTKLEWTVDYANVIGGSNSLAPIDSISQTLTNSNYSNNQVTYHVTPTANFCPGNTFDYVVTVKKAPNLIVTPTASLCEGGSTQLFAVDAFSSGQLFYNWSNASTLNNPYIFNPIASPTSDTTYSVSVIDNTTQCQITRSIEVTVLQQSANITYSSATAFCQGGSVTLQANSSAGLSYQWELNDIAIPGATGSAFNAISSGIYTVVVTNSNGCSKTSNGQTVIVNPLPIADVSNLSSTTFCQGESVIFHTTNVAGNTYQWRLNGVNITGAGLYSFEADGTGSYSVQVTNANSCSALSPAIDVLVNPLPEVNISALDSTLCFGENTALLATGASTYSWTPAGLVSNSSIANPNVFPTSTTNFGVMGTDLNGCSDYQEIQIVVVPNPSLDLPSSIEACQGSMVSLPGSASIAWTGVTSANDFSAEQSGYAIATLQNSNFCSSTDSIYIQVNLLPLPNISGSISVCANSYYSEYTVNSTGNLFSWNVSNGEFQGVDNGNTAIIHWFDQEYGPSTFVTVTEHDIHSGCDGSDTLFVAFTGLAPNSTVVNLLYPNGSTLFSADHYAIMNWGSTIISNNVDEYTNGHAQYYTFDNFDTALRYYWIEAGDDSLCLTRSYFNPPVWQVGIQETTDNSLFSLYPNPTSGILNLSVDGKNSISSFSIYNCTGHLVKQEFNFKNQSVIDVSELPVGFYILKANDNKGSNFNQTFIKQ